MFLGLADQELTCMLRKDQARQCPYVFNQPTLAWRTMERGRRIKEEAQRAWKQSSVPKVEWLCGNGRNSHRNTQHWPHSLPVFAEERKEERSGRINVEVSGLQINEASVYGKTSDVILLGGQSLLKSRPAPLLLPWLTSSQGNSQH